MNIIQKAYGAGNHQTTQIFNRPLDPVDICADKISSLLSTIAKIDFLQPPTAKLIPPKIEEKNLKNKIDEANALEIEATYALWDEISLAISADATGVIASNYGKAAFILNQVYLAKFQQDFPSFKLYALTVYCQSANAGSDDAYLLIHLMHYMYLSCQVGVKP